MICAELMGTIEAEAAIKLMPDYHGICLVNVVCEADPVAKVDLIDPGTARLQSSPLVNIYCLLRTKHLRKHLCKPIVSWMVSEA